MRSATVLSLLTVLISVFVAQLKVPTIRKRNLTSMLAGNVLIPASVRERGAPN